MKDTVSMANVQHWTDNARICGVTVVLHPIVNATSNSTQKDQSMAIVVLICAVASKNANESKLTILRKHFLHVIRAISYL